jgi:hypothetical protein
MFCLIVSAFSLMISANDAGPKPNPAQWQRIETFLLEPVELENISIWVPADRIGPLINRSCRPDTKCSYSSMLPASVNHTKTQSCPEEVARLLAEFAAPYHEKKLPLTIFNGWQWEYSYSLSQFESATYDLAARGGCWEGSWEAILAQSAGSLDFEWVEAPSLDKPLQELDETDEKASIEIRTFDFMRMRNGYPKERNL